MTYGERERETIRRLREELEKRQQAERNAPAVHVDLESPEDDDERAEVLFELICL